MDFILSGEFGINSGMDTVRSKYVDIFLDYFKDKTYSESIKRIFIILVCRPNMHKMRQRKKNVDNRISIDLFLDYEESVRSDTVSRETMFFRSLIQLLPIMQTYFRKKVPDFRFEDFKNDLKKLIAEIYTV